LNIGSSATRAQLDTLAAVSVMPQAVADALKGLALVPDVISASQVQQALEGM